MVRGNDAPLEAYGLIDGALLWRLKATHGLPLDFALERLAQAKRVPTWDAFFRAARRDGAKVPRLVRELRFFVREAYAAEIAHILTARLEVISREKG